MGKKTDHEGSMNRTLYSKKAPFTGYMIASSPRDRTVVKIKTLTMRYPTNTDPGPPEDNALPEPTNRPAPIAPPWNK